MKYPGIFSRGFILADAPYICPESFENLSIPFLDRTLYYSYDRHCRPVLKTGGGSFVLLYGTVLETERFSPSEESCPAADPEDETPELSSDPERITDKLLALLLKSKEAFYDYLDLLNGRHLIVYGLAATGEVRLLQDATGMRAVYYRKDRPIAASHALLLAEKRSGELKMDPFWESYCRLFHNEENNNIPFPGHRTPYTGVWQLIPNHELDLSTLKMIRFWPRKDRKALDTQAVFHASLLNLQNQARLLGKDGSPYNKHLCLSVTSGFDSRVSLSVMRPYLKQVSCFTCRFPEETIKGTNSIQDSTFAGNLQTAFGIPVRILHLPEETDPDLLAACEQNTSQRHIPRSVMAFRKAFPEDRFLHLRSNLLEIVRGRTYYLKANIPENTPEAFTKYRVKRADLDMCFSNDETDSAQAADPVDIRSLRQKKAAALERLLLPYYEEFWEDADLTSLHGYEYPDILYWEERCGLWHGGSVLPESDLAFDTFCLFNSRRFLQRLLCIPKEYRRKNLFVHYIVEECWPELAFYPPNSDTTLAREAFRIMETPPPVSVSVFCGNLAEKGRRFPILSNIGNDPGSRRSSHPGSSSCWILGFSSENILPEDHVTLKIHTGMKKDIPYDITFSAHAISDTPEDFCLIIRSNTGTFIHKETLQRIIPQQSFILPYTPAEDNESILVRLKRLASAEEPDSSFPSDPVGKAAEVSSISAAVLTILEWHVRQVPEDVQALRDEARRREAEYRRTLHRLDDIKNQKAALRKELEEKEAQNQALIQELKDLRSSVSYRLGRKATAPARFIKDRLQKEE